MNDWTEFLRNYATGFMVVDTRQAGTPGIFFLDILILVLSNDERQQQQTIFGIA